MEIIKIMNGDCITEGLGKMEEVGLVWQCLKEMNCRVFKGGQGSIYEACILCYSDSLKCQLMRVGSPKIVYF